jgi:cell fate (sporulation/competence/biofilm development) regulator YlbF (YheA/YmcA/DUF963 family)
MENVLNQAEQLAEAILESEEYVRMRLAEQAAMRDVEAAQLISAYSERRTEVENLLAKSDLKHTDLADAGAKLEEAQKAMEANPMIVAMRGANEAFTAMMKQVNKIIKFVVTGENEDEEEACASCGDGCGDGCDTCGGGCHCH